MSNANNPTEQDLLTQELTQDGILRLTMNDQNAETLFPKR